MRLLKRIFFGLVSCFLLLSFSFVGIFYANHCMFLSSSSSLTKNQISPLGTIHSFGKTFEYRNCGDTTSYRKGHTIYGSSIGELFDYQVRIVVHFGNGIDDGEHVFCGGRCQSDFDDIRFTDADGLTLLNYWRETYIESDYAVFWVEVPYLHPDSESTIYLYYGAMSTNTLSNLDSTMLFGDDFSGSTLDTGKWSTKVYDHFSPSYNVVNGELHVHTSINAPPTFANWAGYRFLSNVPLPIDNFSILMKGRWENLDYIRGFSSTGFLGLQVYDADNQTTGEGVALRGDSFQYIWRFHDDVYDGTSPGPDGINVADHTSGAVNISISKFGDMWTLQVSGTSTDSWIGEISTVTPPYDVGLSALFRSATQSISVDSYFDSVYVRQYVIDEPTHGGWTSEVPTIGPYNNSLIPLILLIAMGVIIVVLVVIIILIVTLWLRKQRTTVHKYCPSCFARLEGSEEYCGNCGRKLQ